MALSRRSDPRGEVELDTGFGHIIELTEPKNGGRNADMKLKAEHLDQWPLAGKVDTKNTALWAAVQAAAVSGQRVAYMLRIERKRGVAPGIPFGDLQKTDKQREWEAITPAGVGAPGLAPAPSQQVVNGNGHGTVATMERDSNPPGRPGGPAPRPAPAAQQAPAVAPAGGRSIPNEPPPRDEPEGGPPVQRDADRPWMHHNPDGTLNLGSYAAQAAAGMIDKAVDLLVQHSIEPTIPRVRALSSRLLQIADEAQASVRSDGLPDRMAASHTRARGMLHTVLRVDPPPFLGPDATEPEKAGIKQRQAEWQGRVTAMTGGLLRLIVDLDTPPSG